MANLRTIDISNSSYRAFLARKYGRWGGIAVAQDEIDYETHDKRYHGGKYDPATQTCFMRQKLEEGDLADVLTAEREEIQYAHKKWKKEEKERKRAEREAKAAEVERKTLSELSSRTYTNEDRRIVNEAMNHVLTAEPVSVDMDETKDLMESLGKGKAKDAVESISAYLLARYPEGIDVTGLGTIVCGKDSVKSIMAHAAHGIDLVRYAVIGNAEALLRKAVIFSTHDRWKDRNWDSINMASPMRIGDRDKVVEFTVKRKPSGIFELYNVKVIPKEIVEEVGNPTRHRSITEQPGTHASATTPHSLPQSSVSVNGENEKKVKIPIPKLPSSNLVRQYLAANGLLSLYVNLSPQYVKQ